MTRPLYVATVAIAALLAFAAFAMETATAGGRVFIAAPQAGVSANARTAVLPGFPDVSGSSVAPRFEARHGFGHGYSPYDYRLLATGDFRYGRLYDTYLNGPYGYGQGGYYTQPGPQIITLGAPVAGGGAGVDDALVIAAPPQAAGFQHGVRIISLTDPPAEFQLQRAPVDQRYRK